MSPQAKSILKKFRKAKTTIHKPIIIAKEFQVDKQKEKQNAEIDPLSFLDKYSKEAEVKPGNIDEYIKIEKKEDKKDQGRPTIMGMGGAYGNFKLNFADILKARQNLGKKENTMPVLKPIVKAINNETKEVHKEENKESDSSSESDSEDKEKKKENKEEKKEEENIELNLPELTEERKKKMLERLQKAKRRFAYYYEKKNRIRISENILRRARELKEKIDIPQNLLQKVQNVLDSLKLPNKCIIDDDVQIIQEYDPANNNNMRASLKKKKPKIDLAMFMKKK